MLSFLHSFSHSTNAHEWFAGTGYPVQFCQYNGEPGGSGPSLIEFIAYDEPVLLTFPFFSQTRVQVDLYPYVTQSL